MCVSPSVDSNTETDATGSDDEVDNSSNNWLIGFVNEQYGKNPKKATSGISRLDQRYRPMPHFPGLKIFNHTAVSKIQQWTGREQRALLRQMVAAYAP
jgi:hypothetical protein